MEREERKERDAAACVVLMVDDDEEDIYLTRRAFGGRGERLVFRHVTDEASLFAYLDNEGGYADRTRYPRPRLILLDINMPRVNGFELLRRIRESERHAPIPVVMLSTSSAETDVDDAYRLGANSFISKPVSASGMAEIARHVDEFWFEAAKVP